MNIQNFISELKRRNVFKVATAYAIAGWLIIQVATSVFPAFDFPDWTQQFVIILTLIGFPITLVIAWAFELTPQGLKTTKEVDEDESIAHNTGKRINKVIIGSLVLLIGVLIVERFFIANVVDEEDQAPQIISNVSSQSVAVLPFADMSQNKDQDWFSDGLTEEILNSLAQLPELKVTSRTSAFQFKGKDIDISLIADTLGVANIVEGSVRRIGDQLRVTAQLIRAEDGFHLWSEQYDSSTDNLFEVQTSIAEEIATTLDVYLDENKRNRMFSSGTRNVEAFELYLKGVDIYNEAHETSFLDQLWVANEYFDRALELDPGFGEASLYKMDAYAHILVDGQLTGKEQDLTKEEAKEELIEVVNYGAEHVEDPVLKITSKMNAVLFSDSWYQMPSLLEDLKKAMGEKLRIPPASIWTSEILLLYQEQEIMDNHTRSDLEVDPLSLISWQYRLVYAYSFEGLNSVKEVVEDSKNAIGNSPFLNLFEHFVMGISGNTDELNEIYEGKSVDTNTNNIFMLQFYSYIAAVAGEEEISEKIYTKYEELMGSIDDIAVITLYELGRTEEANEEIARLDSQPSGPANLALGIATLGNTIYFDMDYAPNLAARFKEAEIDISEFKKMPWVE